LRLRLPKTIRNTLVSIIILIGLFVAAGTAYVLISGRSTSQPAVSDVQIKPPTLPKPSQPSPKAPESAAVEALTSPVSAGANSSVSVKTNAGSSCTISVTYNDVPSKDSGLTPKVADAYGTVTWTWTVDKSAAIGTWPVKVTCAYNGRSAVVIANLQVVK
jgi:hypothetical protein